MSALRSSSMMSSSSIAYCSAVTRPFAKPNSSAPSRERARSRETCGATAAKAPAQDSTAERSA
eukprot:8548829-Lingulodinium_polyedra.AAC.1